MKSSLRGEAEAWGLYWQGGHRATCFEEHGAFTLYETWRSFFERLPARSRVLDLATGNGDVALIAAETSSTHRLEFEISAVDQADIMPAKSLDPVPEHLDAIKFLGNTHIESLPFENECFNAITSQYGFEYSHVKKSAAEIARVSMTGVLVQMVLHAQNGAVHKASQDRLTRARKIISRGQILDTAANIGSIALAFPHEGQKLLKLERKFWGLARAIQNSGRKIPEDDISRHALRFLGQLINRRKRYDPKDVVDSVNRFRKEVAAYVMRLNAMNSAALSANDVKSLVDRFEFLGFTDVSCTSIQKNSNNVAWLFRASH